VSGEGEVWTTTDLLARVRLTDEPALGSEVAARLPAATDPRGLSVTDLLAPRRAYWRRVRGPAPLPLEREARLERGRAWHRRLGDRIAADGSLEVRVRRDGLTARIDLLADVPVEIKTGSPPAGGGDPEDWPEQVQQLAAYAALVGASAGRLAHLAVPDEGTPRVSVGELRFRSLEGVRAELGERRDALRSAITLGRPERLPRCRWFERGCEYRAAGLCDCQGDEPRPGPGFDDLVEHREARDDLAARWTTALGAEGPAHGRAPAHFRDLLYPRRSFFDRTSGRPPQPLPPRPPVAPLDAYERVIAALEAGPVGDVHRLPGTVGGPEEDVLAWRGAPCLVRSSRVRVRLTSDEIRARFPQYLLDLGFRCGVTGVPRATLVLGYEPPPSGELPVQVFRVEFPEGIARFAAGWDARRAAWEASVERGTPEGLPACPTWMVASCPYRDVCGCSDPAPRSQR
jgi:CRISPR/Cas system-associated exonuclease Cas4 (RecB family)